MTEKTMLAAKCNGIMETFKHFRDPDRDKPPLKEFGEDYNRLVQATRSTFPSLQALLPPEVPYVKTGSGYITGARYCEIATYAAQVYEMLSAIDSTEQ